MRTLNQMILREEATHVGRGSYFRGGFQLQRHRVTSLIQTEEGVGVTPPESCKDGGLGTVAT